MRKIGVFGGTFDPVHWGHLLIAKQALNQVALEQVIWIPVRYPPHKIAAKFEHRWQMVAGAIADYPSFAILPFQKNDSSPTYAIQTLINLQSLYPNTHWYWIVGLDTFLTLPRWYRRQELVPACDWLVASRGRAGEQGGDCEAVCEGVAQELKEQGIGICWQLLSMPLVEVSSSLIRQYCLERVSIQQLVPEVVRVYITTHNLYIDRTK